MINNIKEMIKLIFEGFRKMIDPNEMKKAIERQKQKNYIIEQQYKELKEKETKE